MIIKDFENEQDARVFRTSKRDEGLAASLFTYGKDRYRVKVAEPTHREGQTPKEAQQWTQHWLSTQAYNISKDIEDLAKIKELIADPDFGCEIEDVTFVAKKLEEEHWFATTSSVIGFFDYPADSIEKIKEMVDNALKEYEDDWNDKRG